MELFKKADQSSTHSLPRHWSATRSKIQDQESDTLSDGGTKATVDVNGYDAPVTQDGGGTVQAMLGLPDTLAGLYTPPQQDVLAATVDTSQLSETGVDAVKAIDKPYITVIGDMSAVNDISAGRHEVVVVDATVVDWQTLVAGISPDTPLLVLHPDANGMGEVEVLAAFLSQHQNLDAIHLVTEGRTGALLLGNEALYEGDLQAASPYLAEIGSALKPGGDLMLYGCSVAAGDAGQQFVDDLTLALGGVDVAASTDRTGPTALGGDWDLEYSTGAIDTVLPFTLAGMQDISHCLGCTLGTTHGYHVVPALASAPATYPGYPILDSASNVVGWLPDVSTGYHLYYTTTTSNLGRPSLADFETTFPTLCATANAAPTFVTATTASLTVAENASSTNISSYLAVTDTDASQTETFTVSTATNHGGTVTVGTTVGSGTNVTPTGWSYTPAAGFAGVETFTIQVSDGTATATRSFSISVTPATPGTPALATASDSGSSNSDAITNAASLNFSGTSAASDTASTVRVFLDKNGNNVYDAGTDPTATATVSNGSWSITGVSTAGVSDGTYNVYAVVTSATGSLTSSLSTASSVIIDKTAPTITFNGLAFSADTGTSATDFITKTAAQTISATLSGAPAGTDIVYGSLDNGSTWTNITSKVSGTTLTWNGVTLASSNTLQLKVTDNAGNDGTVNSQAYVLDTVAPTTTIASKAFSADSGTSSSDFITNTASQTISGTLSANLAAGEIVEVSLDNGSTWTTASATVGLNTWSLSGQTLTASNTLQVRVSDTAGNNGTASTQAYTLDAVAPTAGTPVAGDLASPSAASFTFTVAYADTGVGIDSSSIAAGNVTVTGPGAVGTLTVTGASYSAGVATYTVQAPHTGVWNGASDAGSYSIDINANSVKDVAGNAVAAAAGAKTFNVTFSPTTTVSLAALSADTGSSASDWITNSAAQTISGTLSAALVSGESVEVSYDNGLNWTNATSFSVGSAVWSSTTTLAGSDTFQARVSNSNGSSTAFSHTYTLDTTATAPGLALAADTGSSAADLITSNGTVDVTGLESGASWEYSSDAGAHWNAGSGSSFTVTGDGAKSVIVRQTDVAGNTSADSTAFAFTLDTTVAAPSAADLTTDSGSSASDNLTNDTTPTFTGSAEANATVTLYDTDGTTVLGSTTADGSGNWSITSATLADGSHTVTSKATDVAGNVSTASAGLSITIDSAIAQPSTPDMTAGTDSGSSASDNLTNDTTPSFTGSAEIGSTVTLYDTDGTTVLGTATADGSGNWSITSSTLSEGSHSLTVKATDVAGNVSIASGSLSVNIDTIAPNAPSVADLTTDSGSSSSDNLTNDTTPTFTGTAEAGATVTLYDTDGTTVLGTTTADGSGNWSITSTTLADGAHTVTSKATDAAGNVSTASTGLGIVIDSATAQPSTPNMTAGTDSGSSNSDNITSNLTPTFTGSAEIGSTVTLYDSDGSTVLGTATADGSGNWSITSSTLSEGAHSLTVKATDVAGNVSIASGSLSVTIDASQPNSPSTADLTTDSGSSSSDNLTNDTTPIFTGSAEANATVTLYDTDGTTVLGTTTADGSGNWSITSSTLADGAHTVTTKATDAAGNVSTASAGLSVTIDATPPNSPSAADLTTDSGSSSSDNLTNDTTPTFTGTAEANATVTLYDTDGTTVLGTTTADGSGNWSITSSALADGSHTVTSKATDAAGNVSTASTGLSVTIDSAIAQPSTPDMTAGSDSGSANSDNLTSNQTPTFTGSAEIGSTVSLYDTDGSTVLGTATADGSGNWSITSSTLSEGAHSLTVKATDVAGNVSIASASLSVTIDTAQPNSPSSADLTTDSGSSSSDNLTNDTTPTFTGTAEIGSTVTLYDTDGTTVLGSTSADGSGNWSITSTTLADGAHTVTSKATDAAGNVSTASTGLSINIDSAIAQPSTPNMTAGTDSGSSNSDNITSNLTPTFTGTAEIGSTVTLYDTDGTTVLGTTTADGSGNWSITSSTLTEGAHSLTVKATDVAGNVSIASGSLSVTIDTTAPNAPSVADLATASDSGSSSSDNLTNDTTPTFTGTAEANAIVTLYDTDGTTVLGTATADGSGNWSITSTTLADGSHTVTTKATDAAGNVSTASAGLSVTIDTATTTPSVPDLATASDSGVSSSDDLTNDTTPSFTGTAEANATVSLYDTDGSTVLGSTTADGAGNWSITSSTLADGVHSVSAKAVDAAGNESSLSSGLSVTIDTVPPAVPSSADLAAASDSGSSNSDNVTRNATPTFTGTAAAGVTVNLYDSDGTTLLGTATADQTGNWTITSSALSDGSHTITVKTADATGNQSAAAAGLDIVIDTLDPSAATGLLAVDENSANGSVVGTVTADDANSLRYSLTDDAGGRFAIDSVTGQVIVADGSLLDYETASSHTITVRATDPAGNLSDSQLTVTLNDVNDPPTLTVNTGFTVDEGESHILSNSELSVADVDNPSDELIYTLSAVTANGTLYNDGTSLGIGDSFSQADIDNGLISYTESKGNAIEDAFSFTVSDGSGGVIGATTFTINVIHDLTIIGNPKQPQTLIGDGGRNDHLFGGKKIDSLQGLGGNDYLSAGKGKDALIGDSGNDILWAASGKDSLNGDAGNDLLYGGNGSDLLIGGDGNDYLIGGSGRDTYRYTAASLGADDLSAGGYDVINDGNGSRIDFSSGVESALQLNGSLLSALTGKVTLGDSIDANNGIAYSQGIIMIDINGDHAFNADDDFSIELVGRIGGVHYDSQLDMLVLDGGSTVTEPDGPASVLQSQESNGALDGTDGDDILIGWNGNNSLDGGAGNDDLYSGNGNDSLSGGDGDDLLDGGSGSDTLEGGSGADTLWGQRGKDLLIGGAGNDMLVGGGSRDTYRYLATELDSDDLTAGGYDIIQDGKRSVIDFSEEMEATLTIGGTTLSELVGKIKLGSSINADNNIALTTADGVRQLQIDIDGDGSYDRATDFHIELVGNVSKATYDAALDVFVLG